MTRWPRAQRRPIYWIQGIIVPLLLVAIVSCNGSDDDDDETPSPGVSVAPESSASSTVSESATATATATAAPPTAASTPTTAPTATAAEQAIIDCPDHRSVCEFAFAYEKAIAAKDWNTLAGFFEPTLVTCEGPPYQGLYDVACEGKAKGETVERVYISGIAKEGTGYAADTLAEELPRFHDGAMAVYAIGTPASSQCDKPFLQSGAPPCRNIVLADLTTGRAVVFQIRLGEDRSVAEGPKSLAAGFLSAVVMNTSAIGGTYWTHQPMTRQWSDPVQLVRQTSYGTVAAGGDCLNVRTEPTVNSKSLACIPDKMQVGLLGRETPDGWVYLVVHLTDGRMVEGFAAREFVK